MAKNLIGFSNELAELVQSSGPAIVRVEGRRRTNGSGIAWAADGLIITANHVVRRDDSIMVGLGDGDSLPARLVGRDESTDVALLKVDHTDLTPLPLADEAALSVGHLALALGRPGKTVQASLGIISAHGGKWRSGMGGEIDSYLQTDVVMYPGFSGGPLVSASGALLGLNTSGFGPGVSLAIPHATLTRVAETLGTHGRVRRGYLGVSTQRVRLPEDVRETLSQRTGLLVVSVEAGSPAAEGGLVLGDAIIGLSDKAIQNHDDLLAALAGDVVGTKVPVRILRGGELREVVVTIAERK